MSEPAHNATTASQRHSIPFFADIYNGAVFGDFADELGLVGYTTQAAIGFVPIIGAFCAFRDFRACRQKKDRIGMVLNGLACIPFIGFFPKTAVVIRAAAEAGNAAVYASHVHGRVHNHLPTPHDSIPSSS